MNFSICPIKLCHLTALALLTLFSGSAQAIASCSVGASGVAFGSYNVNNPAPTDATGNVEVTCSLLGLISLLVSYDITFSTGASGNYGVRTLGSSANTLAYNLYTTAGRTTIWGNGTAGTGIISDGYLLALFTTVRTYTIHGRLPANQNKPAGLYQDTITVTVNY